MELLFDLIAWPVIGILQSLAGILWPSDDLAVRRLQRISLVTLLAGLAFAAAAAALAYFSPSWHVLTLLAIAGVLFVGSGFVGNKIETICKGRRTPRS